MATTVYDAFIKNVISLPSDAPVTCTQIACNDEYIAFTALSNEICIFGVDEVEEKPVILRNHLSHVSAICFGNLKNPTYLCTASEDSIYIWRIEQVLIDFKTGMSSHGLHLAKELGPCSDICFSPDDLYVSASIGKEAWIIDIEKCELVQRITGHLANINASIFCPHQVSTFVTVSEDRTFKVWNSETGALTYQSSVIGASQILCIAMHPEHMHFAIGGEDGKIRVFDLITHRCLYEVDACISVIKRDLHSNDICTSSHSGVTKHDTGSCNLSKEGQKHNEYRLNDGDFVQCCSIIRLAYWRRGTCKNKFNEDVPTAFIEYEDVVQEVLKESPILIAGCTSVILLFDANTMNCIFHLDLTVPIRCAERLDPSEDSISVAGCYAFAVPDDSQKVHCLVGSLLRDRMRILAIHSTRSDFTDSCSPVEKQLAVANLEEAILPQLSVLSSAAIMTGSPLLSCLAVEKKSNPPKDKRISDKKKMLNHPLTFNKKVTSSGYCTAPRSSMFQPKLNSKVKLKAVPRKHSENVKRSSGLASHLTSDVYPTRSDPPVHYKEDIKLLPFPTAIKSLKFSATGKQMACALGEKNAFIFRVPYNGKVSSFVGHNNIVNSTEISNTNLLLLTASNDKTAKLWSPSYTSPLLDISRVKHNFQVENTAQYSDKGNQDFSHGITKAGFYYVDKFLLISCLNTLYLYNYTIEQTSHGIQRYQNLNRYSIASQFKVEDAQQITTFSTINGFYSYIVLAACSDKSIAVFDMNIGKIVRRMWFAHDRSVHTICQNHGSAYVTHPSEAYDLFLTSAIADGIKLWDLRTDRCVRKYSGHLNRSHTIGLSFSPCSRYIATGSEDRNVYIFDIRNSAYLHRITGHTDVVSCVDFHPEIPMLVAGSLDGRLYFYNES